MKKYLSNYFPSCKVPQTPPPQREFYFGNTLFNQEQKFPSNFIRTSKYSLLSFFPIACMLQFKRYANVYFLLTAILQSIKQISPLDPITGWAPLVFVIGLSMLREGLEDYFRHKSDIEMNSTPCKVYSEGKFITKQWAEIMVGDIILVEEMEVFPADLIVLATNQESGNCYMETSSLDGEKNLKERLAPKETCDKFNRNNENPIFRLEGRVECDPPKSSLTAFKATLFIKEKNIKVTEKQLLFRGAVLKNSKWIIGIATYTGEHSKIMLNSNPPRSKQSQIECKTNNLILCILAFELLCCVVSAIGNSIWISLKKNDIWYLSYEQSAELSGFLMFFTYFLLNNTMIPISLIISLEFVKLAQAYLIEKDMDLYDPEKKRFAKVFTSSINEELGQIEYIFTDKTGTLTCNKMEFKLALIGVNVFGDQRILIRKNNKKSTQFDKRPTYVDKKEGVVYSFDDLNLLALIKGDTQNSKYSILHYELTNREGSRTLYVIKDMVHLVNEFLKLLSTCHECLVDSEKNEDMIRYQGPSPDEITLVDTARHLGFIYLGRSMSEMSVDWMGQKKKIELLRMFEFNSDRKRMSVLIREENILKLYVKGADNVIKQRLNLKAPQPFLNEVYHQLQVFSIKGFRTLVLGMKIVEEEEYEEFSQKMNKANDDKDMTEKLIDDFEKGFFLLGVTAVEDKLQEEVPETIHDFLKANIKVWMLTGDKMETAENIGRSCNLIQDHFSVMKLLYNKEKDVPELIKERLKSVLEENEELTKKRQPKALLLECEAIQIIMDKNNISLKEQLIQIVKNCEAVVCFRMIPLEKANMVKLVKENLNKITLSIGDGANDVNMIQEAHIGVGLYGEEGMRAVQASDFALVRFKGLWKLIFVHGKWSYIRISEMILYFFYKNMVFTICQFYFSFYCGYSGTTIYDDYYITFYNLIFTALPLVVRAIIEQDVYYKFPLEVREELLGSNGSRPSPIKEKQILKKFYPKLYYIGQKNTLFTYMHFFSWIWQGVLHGLFVFFFCIYFLGSEVNNKQGYNSDIWLTSITLYTAIILVVNIKLAVYTQYWTVLTVLTLVLTSYGFYFAYIWISDQFSNFTSYQTAGMLFVTPNFYLAVFGCMGVVFGFDLFLIYFRTELQTDILEKVKLGIKRGMDRSESFFKDLFEKKPSFQEETSKIKIERMNSSQKKDKNDNSSMIIKKNDMDSFCKELIEKKPDKKEKNEVIYFQKIDVELGSLNS